MYRRFLFSFHDFSVFNYESVMPIIYELRNLLGFSFSVLVIPCTEGASESSLKGFRNSLNELKNDGFELALHGYKHKAEFSQGRSYMGLLGMNLTHGEAEFAGLSEYESLRLLKLSIKAWNELSCDILKINPVAFIPPTWYSNKFLPTQVLLQKMLYEDRFFLINSSGKRYLSPVISFAGLSKTLQKVMFSLGNVFLKIPLGIPRIAVHPVDFPYMQSEINDLIRECFNNNRKLIHYSEV